jgi:hypothetical protein
VRGIANAFEIEDKYRVASFYVDIYANIEYILQER